jgi:putative MATE family efflux protein
VPASSTVTGERASASPMADRTRQMLDAPITPTLLRLAAPNVVLMIVQALANVIEIYYVGWLGTDALAGVTLVFPVILLMQTMSAGGMGGGVSSAIARALGAGRQVDADALAIHGLLIALGCGALFTLGVVGGGPALYRALGGQGASLAAALAYSNVVFSGALAFWVLNTLANVLRGSGNMLVPAAVIIAGALVLVTLSPALIFGWGPFPRLGIAGAGVALVTYYAIGAVALAAYLCSGRSLVRLAVRGVRLRWDLCREILHVGGLGTLNTLQASIAVLAATAFVGRLGTSTLAGYGMGSRLEYLQIPLVFGLGAALVAMVGTNIGAGRHARAERVAWIGAALAGAGTGLLGALAAVVPRAWLGLFSDDPAVIGAGAHYLRVVGPTYGFFGAGLALYFASQGAGRLFWAFVGGLARLAIVVIGGWLAVAALDGGAGALYGVLALGLGVFGLANAVAIGAGAWRR